MRSWSLNARRQSWPGSVEHCQTQCCEETGQCEWSSSWGRTEDNPGGIITKEAPLAYSNVRIRDPQTGFPVRTAYRYAEDGTKVRVTVGSRASGAIVPRPEKLRARKAAAPAGDGPNDTGPGAAAERTFREFAASGAG